MNGNRGQQSTGYGWIFALTSLFGLGVLYIVFNMVFRVYLSPILIMQLNETITDETLKSDAIAGIQGYLLRWENIPVLLFGIVVIYMFVLAIRKESESTYTGDQR